LLLGTELRQLLLDHLVDMLRHTLLHKGKRPLQVPLPGAFNERSLCQQILYHMHHEEGIALGALANRPRQGMEGIFLPTPQPPVQIFCNISFCDATQYYRSSENELEIQGWPS